MRSRVKPLVELMASLPSVVLGYVAALGFGPAVAGESGNCDFRFPGLSCRIHPGGKPVEPVAARVHGPLSIVSSCGHGRLPAVCLPGVDWRGTFARKLVV